MIHKQLQLFRPGAVFGVGNALLSERYGDLEQDTAGTGEMSCRDTIHLICWYLEGRLSASVEGEIKRHLESCADCHMVLDAAINTLDKYFNSGRPAGSAIFRAA